ncbi:MAG TPA: CPBP family intramembrane glutamic endopeptidase [Gemmatimonadaceae bacterium]|nr:CPBP family intramembrane glutamic endopeptidase [Gemmatimonadaceae bacterium]
MPTRASTPGARAQSYWKASRSPRYSLLFALPLLVFYEVLAAAVNGHAGHAELRNGADVLLKEAAIALVGPYGPLLLMGAVVLTCLGLAARDLRRAGGGLRAGTFALMLAESGVLALLFGLVVGLATAELLGHIRPLAAGPVDNLDGPTKLMLSLGAGLYEELLFRVLLVGSLAAAARVVLGMSARAAGVLATVVGALAFSAFHYIGPYGEPLRLQSFTYRAISGVVFSVLYLTRGFGITAWTHALYDVWVMLL